MPSSRDTAHGGVSTRKSATAAAGFARSSKLSSPRPGQAARSVMEGGMDRLLQHKISPGWVTLLQPAGRASVLGHLSSLRPHCAKHKLSSF
jgi:hypothetical protein